jgi:hypothetical protein
MRRLTEILEKANKAILVAGALAVAIGAIVLLVNQLAPDPTPTPKPSASFERIEAPREITLGEYEADGGSLPAAYLPAAGRREGAAYRLAADVVAPPAKPSVSSRPNVTLRSRTPAPAVETTTSTTPPRETKVHTQDMTVHVLPSTSTTSTSTSPSTTSAGGGETYFLRSGSLPSNSYRVPNAIIQEGSGTSPGEVSEVLADRRSEPSEGEEGTTSTTSTTSSGSQYETYETYDSSTTPLPGSEPPAGAHSVVLPRKCARCALLPILESALADSNDNAATAARELRAAEREWRERNRDGRPQLVGVEVDYRLDLKGFAGKKVTVKYTIYEAGRHLSEDWWGLRVADQGTEPREPVASIPEKLWALIPQVPGTYYLHLELYSGGTELEDADTPKFH